MNLLLFPYIPTIPVIARDVLHVGPTLMGILQAAEGLGALFGAVLIASAVKGNNHNKILLGGSFLALIALLVFSISHWYVISCLMLLLLGLGTVGFVTMQSAIVMLVAEQAVRGRALGVVSLAFGAAPLGSLLLVIVTNALGPTCALTINAMLGMIAVAFIALLLPIITDCTRSANSRQT